MRALLGIIVLVFSFSCLGQSQEPPNTIPPIADKAKGSDSAKQNTKAPLLVKSLPPVQADPKSSGEKPNREHEATNWAEWLIAIATLILAAITAGLVFYTKKLWGITRVLAGEAKQSSEQQLRAYVFAKHDKPMFLDPSGALSVEIAIKNFGQTPANEVICHVFICLHQFPLSVSLDPPDYTKASKSPVAPSETIKQFPTMPRPMTGAEEEAVTARKGAIFVWGEVMYVDIFKNPRRTRFCLYSTGEDFARGELAYHHEGNDAN